MKHLGSHFSNFYVAGGTLRPDSPSYVERQADRDLYNYLKEGKLCYVLASRQLGKSSLIVRAARRLKKEKYNTAIVDLTMIGTDQNTDVPERWYLGVAASVAKGLGLPFEYKKMWTELVDFPAIQRLSMFFSDFVLSKLREKVIIFFDEIDTTLRLNSKIRDDFFAFIRACFNARALESIWERITFVFIGVASPSDLITDKERTPFNVGKEIKLTDFTLNEATVLAQGLHEDQLVANRLLKRILAWTNGHPYLTQRLCEHVANHEKKLESPESLVNEIAERTFLSRGADQKDSNLSFIRDWFLRSSRAKSQLQVYRKVWSGKLVQSERQSITQAELKLCGIVTIDKSGYLKIRNKIYREVFTELWIRKIEAEGRIGNYISLQIVHKTRQLPFRILVIGEFAPKILLSEHASEIIPIDADSFNERMSALNVQIDFTVPNFTNPCNSKEGKSSLYVALHFKAISDFDKNNIVLQIPILQQLKEKRTKLTKLRNKLERKRFLNTQIRVNIRQETSRRIEDKSKMVLPVIEPGANCQNSIRDSESCDTPYYKDATVTNLSEEYPEVAEWSGGSDNYGTIRQVLDSCIVNIDRAIRLQIKAIINHDLLRKLEATWRGLQFLVEESKSGAKTEVVLEFFNASKKTLYYDFNKNYREVFASNLFKVFNREYISASGRPYGLIVIDFEFENNSREIDLLTNLSYIGEANSVPIVTSIGSGFLGMDSFDQLCRVNDSQSWSFFNAIDYQSFKDFRELSSAKFVYLTLPRTLLRLPLNSISHQLADDDGVLGYFRRHGQETWISFNSAFALAIVIMREFQHGWQLSIKNWRELELNDLIYESVQGRKESLPVCTDGHVSRLAAAELVESGFIPFISHLARGTGTFFGLQSSYRPKLFKDYRAEVMDALSGNLMVMLFYCRFAQELKCLVHDQVKAVDDLSTLRETLTRFLGGYCSVADTRSDHELSLRPLNSFAIEIQQDEYNAEKILIDVTIRPNSQLIGTEIELRFSSQVYGILEGI